MRRGRPALAALLVALLVAAPAGAIQLTTSIDLDYVYEQEDTAGDVEAGAKFRQKYGVKYDAATPVLDYSVAARLELEEGAATDAASSSRVAPTLELTAKGTAVSAKFSSQAVISTTDAFDETAERTTYSTNLSGDVQLTPEYWPEVRLKLQRKRSLEPEASDNEERTAEFVVRKDVGGLILEYNAQRTWSEDVLPERGTSDASKWSGKATYKNVLWGETEFELSYSVDEEYQKDFERGVFVSDDETSGQEVRTRLEKTIALSALSEVKLGWEYLFEQDFTGQEFDAKVANKYKAALRFDPFPALKLSADLQREDRNDRYAEPKDDEGDIIDGLVLKADLEPVSWLRVSSKADVRWEQGIRDNTGKSVDRRRIQKYETILRAKSEAATLTLNGTSGVEDEDGWTTSREGKFKGELEYQVVEGLKVKPSYEASRLTEWEVRIPLAQNQGTVREWKIQFDYNRQLLDLLKLTFQHGYGIKTEENADIALDLTRTVQLNEQTRMSLMITDLIRGLKLEGVIDRRASDTEDDDEPMIVDVSFALKLDFKKDPIGVSSSLKYNDKGDAFDDLTFNAKLEWRDEELTVSGEYQFAKVYSDETDEDRKLNLKFSYEF